MEHYMDLLAFVERIAKANYGETHAALVIEARRLLATEEQAAVHLANECPECGGAGYYDNGEGVPPEPCGVCHTTGNALRPVPAVAA